MIALQAAKLLEELRVLGLRLKAYQNAGDFPREKAPFYIGGRPCTSGYANQILAAIVSPPRIDDVGLGAATKRLVEWHVKLLTDANAELEDPNAEATE